MPAKNIVQDFYKSDAFLDPAVMDTFIHPDMMLDWNSSKGFLQLKRDEILTLTAEMSKAYVRSKIRISHILAEGNLVSVRYSHFVKTIENPREEMLLAH